MFKTLLISLWMIIHPVHVSLLSIDYDRDSDSFKVFVKVYVDDFLLDSGISDNVQDIDFSDLTLPEPARVVKYFDEKIVIYVNDKQLSGKLTDMNLADGELNVNLLFNAEKKINTITVKNLIMTSLYNDQSNMIIVRVNDFEEGVKLTSEKTEQTFNIK